MKEDTRKPCRAPSDFVNGLKKVVNG